MAKHLSILLAAFTLPALASEPLPCPPQAPDEPLLYMSELPWGQSLEQMREKFAWVYASGKRLKGRAHLDAAGNYVAQKASGPVRIPAALIRNVRRHIEISLERRYADFVFFPDMGHSHFFLPEAAWDAIHGNPALKDHEAYEKMLELPSLKVLYHTAEQLAVREGKKGDGPFPQDKTLLWRYFSRNPIGDNETGENVAPHFAFHNDNYNTVHELRGHRSYSAGFSISASKDGCFAYTAPDGKVYRYDLGLEDLPYSSGNGGDLGASLRRWKQHMEEFGRRPTR